MNTDTKPPRAELSALIANIAAAPFCTGLRLTVTPENPSLPVDYRTRVVGVEVSTGDDGGISLVLTANNDIETNCHSARQVADVARRMLAGDACEDERDHIRTAAALAVDKPEHLGGRAILEALERLAPYWQRAAHGARSLLKAEGRL